MVYQILYHFHETKVCELESPTVSALKEYLYKNVFHTTIPVILHSNGKLLQNKDLLQETSLVSVSLPLYGGKGGFGANLRKQSKKVNHDAILDIGSCRDINGRRMRNVNAAIAMKKWREMQEKIEELKAQGKEDEAKLVRIEAPKHGIHGWYADLPSWVEGLKQTRRKYEREKLKEKMCFEWLKARSQRDPPPNAPRHWGCPRGTHCPYAHGPEELEGVGREKYLQEQKTKKEEEALDRMNKYINYGSTIEDTIEDSFNEGFQLAQQSRQKRKVEQEARNSSVLDTTVFSLPPKRKQTKGKAKKMSLLDYIDDTPESKSTLDSVTSSSSSSSPVSPSSSYPPTPTTTPVTPIPSTNDTIDIDKPQEQENQKSSLEESKIETKDVPEDTLSVQLDESKPISSEFFRRLSILDGHIMINEDGIIQGASEFSTIRLSNILLVTGKYYFESTILRWADSEFKPNEQENNGVGDDNHSYSFDGVRGKKWNNSKDESYGQKWSVGDVIGCLIDIDNRQISFSLNGKTLGTCFENINTIYGLYPACSLENEESILINLGQTQFEYDIPYGYKSLWTLTSS
ncbi:hypothetical protein WA158_005298 [Blastocystis sp. Blastoise]